MKRDDLQMYSFRNDYSETAHINILNALIKTNMEYDAAYGLDGYCAKAADKIKELVGNTDVDIHFLVGGTQTNLIALSSFLRPHEAIIAADSAHISVHETGAIEASGHKIVAVPNKNGKITAGQIEEQLALHIDEHMVKPRLVKISNATELGTVYSKAEIKEISDFCRENNLYLYVDGARIGAAIDALSGDLTLKDMCELTDAFYIGGTKNGAMLGEALIIKTDCLKSDFRYLIKQKGGMLAKGRILGIQFNELFTNGLFFELARGANKMADALRDSIASAGYEFFVKTKTNQVFPIFPNELVERFSEKFTYQFWQAIDENSACIRLVTSWATTEDAVKAFADWMSQNTEKQR